ncbi:MAG: hypothetical protein AB7S36_13960 [Planctomycetota bacterium]
MCVVSGEVISEPRLNYIPWTPVSIDVASRLAPGNMSS